MWPFGIQNLLRVLYDVVLLYKLHVVPNSSILAPIIQHS